MGVYENSSRTKHGQSYQISYLSRCKSDHGMVVADRPHDFFPNRSPEISPNGGPHSGRKHVDVRLDCHCSRIRDLLPLRRIV